MADLARLSNVAAVTIKAYARRGLLGRVKSVAAEPKSTTPMATPTSVLPAESWSRVVLMPGLELQVKVDAGSGVQSVAERLVANFAQLLTTRG